MVLVGIGAIWGAGEIVSGVNQGGFNWGVLQALGVAILLTLPALLLPVKTRLLIGLLLLGTYQILLDWLWLEAVRSAPHGGLQGSLAWASMMLMATAIADLINGEIKPRRRGFLISLALLATGLLCGTWLIPISMHRVSASYVLITLGSAGLLYTLVRLIVDDCGKKLRPLSTWGRNPLLLYIIHGFLLALFVLPPFAWWHVQAPAWLVAIQIFVLLVIMHMIARALERRRWYLSA
jgi:fucose 4-O-acetylase-like acetyltransferase